MARSRNDPSCSTNTGPNNELPTYEGSRRGFDYFLTREQLERYQKKPLELRLAWLYQAAVLRHHCPPEVIARQDRFRR